MKRFAMTIRHRSISQQPGTKSGRRPAGKARVQRSSCSLVRFTCTVVLPKRLRGHLCSSLWKSKWKVVLWPNRSVPPCPGSAAPRSPRLDSRRAARTPLASPGSVQPRPAVLRPARGMSGFWIRQVLKTENERSSLGRRTLSRLPSVWPRPTPPRRPAPACSAAAPPSRASLRSVSPVGCPGFGFDRLFPRKELSVLRLSHVPPCTLLEGRIRCKANLLMG